MNGIKRFIQVNRKVNEMLVMKTTEDISDGELHFVSQVMRTSSLLLFQQCFV